MRRRYQLNLHTESEIESEVADYIERFPQGSKRSEEIRKLCLIGYQIIIRGRSEDEAVLHSYDPGLQKAIANYAREERERSQSSNQISELIRLLQNKGKSKEELLVEELLSSNNKNSPEISLLLSKMLNQSGNEDFNVDGILPVHDKAPDDKNKHLKEEHEGSPTGESKKSSTVTPVRNIHENNFQKDSSLVNKRYDPSLSLKKENINDDLSVKESSEILTDAEDLDIDEEAGEIEDPLSKLGF